jgi:hypothetical protein
MVVHTTATPITTRTTLLLMSIAPPSHFLGIEQSYSPISASALICVDDKSETPAMSRFGQQSGGPGIIRKNPNNGLWLHAPDRRDRPRSRQAISISPKSTIWLGYSNSTDGMRDSCQGRQITEQKECITKQLPMLKRMLSER